MGRLLPLGKTALANILQAKYLIRNCFLRFSSPLMIPHLSATLPKGLPLWKPQQGS